MATLSEQEQMELALALSWSETDEGKNGHGVSASPISQAIAEIPQESRLPSIFEDPLGAAEALAVLERVS